MNFSLPYLPERPAKPRETGIAMVMDKGLSLREAEDLLDRSAHLIDYIKLGFGTSITTNRLAEKIKLYQNEGIRVYFGGTLFEAFVIRGLFDDYRKLLDKYSLKALEISDGSMYMNHQDKCNYIHQLSKEYHVLSEVGSKDASVHLDHKEWIREMKTELEAGAVKVIAEARESGTVGIYGKDGMADVSLIDEISVTINPASVLWEAPLKSQQCWFIHHFGANVNLGNISPNELIPLETLRLGLRGDTFQQFLPPSLKQ